ncbi:heat shock protein Hsp20 family [Schizosaccharomyces osmophilus]|uniref:Heat shock protein Hsp20 family n=1 Tax=Schizosaccharomyces osmophilus TaxID=2545709 RepID=A0AAE9WG79_9SCHI|nr:heat shock protein Hsp20 family [Schizosaccharomyces osmophilus]WBW75084.1 heat shock protein Hsp20 family [Schizosaccharomyces osmophilus]
MLFDAFTDHIFDDIFDLHDRSKQAKSAWFACWGPAFELRETDTTVEVDVEVPGIPKDNLHIDLDGRKLTVSGERKPDESQAGPLIRWSERCFGVFSRTIALPQFVDDRMVQASLKDGILSIIMNKKQTESSTKIVEIQ